MASVVGIQCQAQEWYALAIRCQKALVHLQNALCISRLTFRVYNAARSAAIWHTAGQEEQECLGNVPDASD
jgi:hypothetical protein